MAFACFLMHCDVSLLYAKRFTFSSVCRYCHFLARSRFAFGLKLGRAWATSILPMPLEVGPLDSKG
jgi:hypothetical protein